MGQIEQGVWDVQRAQAAGMENGQEMNVPGAGGMQPGNMGPGGMGNGCPPMVYIPVQKPEPAQTQETRLLKENYGRIAPAAFLYACIYAFCMYRNGSGVTFPFFLGSGLLFFCFCISKLGITLKKGSFFYMGAIVLLGVSTFCTDDGRIIFFNKLGIFLLMMSLMLKQYYDTSGWKLGKFLGSICVLASFSIAELGRPFTDGTAYMKNRTKKTDRRILSAALGMLIGLPLVLVVLLLLASADAVFREMTYDLLKALSLGAILNVMFRIALLFFTTYALVACLCKKQMSEKVVDRRRGEPVLAITVTGLLTVLYLWFSGIQIVGLFLGKLQLPADYTYAMYAREGFFQLLAVSFLNLVIVLAALSYFRESKILKGVLTVMSLCTFIMIASSAMRMIIYIQYYYLTFLRILVLWCLLLLAVLFLGVVVNIFKGSFPLFKYSCAVVTVLYLALSFAHPDYIIAKVNVGNIASVDENFFKTSAPYHDFVYLSGLSADAAPALIPFMEETGYCMEAFDADNPVSYARETGAMGTDQSSRGTDRFSRYEKEGFGYYWMANMKRGTQNFGLRTYNVSRHRMLRGFGR